MSTLSRTISTIMTMGRHRLAPSEVDLRDLVGYFVAVAQQLHREEHQLQKRIAEVKARGYVTAEDWLFLAEAVRGGLLFPAHLALMMSAWIEKASGLAESAVRSVDE